MEIYSNEYSKSGKKLLKINKNKIPTEKAVYNETYRNKHKKEIQCKFCNKFVLNLNYTRHTKTFKCIKSKLKLEEANKPSDEFEEIDLSD